MALSEFEQRVCRESERRAETMLRELETLVNIPTGPGSTGLDETRGRLCERLAKLGAGTRLVPGDPIPEWLGVGAAQSPPTAVCERRVAGASVHVMLCGHVDTVHDASSAFNRLTISADRSRCTGPGAVDMKGGLLVAIHALETLAECGAEVSFTFALNSDEETGSFASERALRECAKNATVGLVFEPAMADGGLVVERTGSGQFMLETRGKSAHVGRDFTSGVSAVNAMARAILRVAELARPERGVITNVGPVRADQPANVVSDLARAWGNARFADATLGDQLGAELDAMQTADGTLPRVIVRRAFNRPSKPATPEVMKLAEFARAAAADLGQKLPFGKTGGVCDGNTMQAEGLPTIDTLGVRGGGLHTTDEWVEIRSLVERTQLAAVLIARLANG
ncbi:MAG: M20/M25/M40 family metallo-hydrolase [Phycisphaerales bacterium]